MPTAQSTNRSSEVDAYIERAAPFARPILKRVRKLFHQACPEIQETMKWSFPHFEYKGIVGSMAAFKKHANFGFWKATLLKDPHGILTGVGDTSMGGVKLTRIDDLPPDEVLLSYIAEAVSLNESGKTVPRPKKKSTGKEPKVPPDLQAALRKNQKAAATFDGFSPSHRKEYIAWITEAKQEATRQRRLATTIEWLTEGKPRNWKYIK
jgi:uncharacterized protein YdeI (YjbR/CyaY-like superfamily)